MANKTLDSDLVMFSEAQLPVSQDDLNKPTKEFVINFLTVFFNTFQIDANAIKQPTLNQYDILLSEDRDLYDEFIKIINTYAAISGICEKLFFKDLQIVDITSPTPKRTLKFAKFLVNFVIYFRSKVSELHDEINEFEERQKEIREYNDSTTEAEEKITASKKYREVQTANNEELKQQIEELRKKIKSKKTIMDEKKTTTSRLEEKEAENFEIYNTKLSKANKINNITSELKGQVVDSPEKLNSQKEELEKEKELQIQEREMKYELLKDKIKLVEQKEQTHSLIQNESAKLAQIVKIITDMKNFLSKLESIKKEKESYQSNISKLGKSQEIEESHCNVTNNKELHDQMGQRLLPLRSQSDELLKDIKEAEIKIGEEKEIFCEISTKKNTINREISTAEAEIAKFLKKCNQLYDKEISSEINACEKIMESGNIE